MANSIFDFQWVLLYIEDTKCAIGTHFHIQKENSYDHYQGY